MALAYGANRVLAPTVDYVMAPGQRAMPTGKLALDGSGRAVELSLVTAQVFASELRPLLATPIPVQVLWLRSPEENGATEPEFQVFADLRSQGAPVDTSAPNAEFLRGRALDVFSMPPGSRTRSHVRLPGDAAPRGVQRGTLNVQRTLGVAAVGGEARTRVEGTLELTTDDGAVLKGTFDVRLAR